MAFFNLNWFSRSGPAGLRKPEIINSDPFTLSKWDLGIGLTVHVRRKLQYASWKVTGCAISYHPTHWYWFSPARSPITNKQYGIFIVLAVCHWNTNIMSTVPKGSIQTALNCLFNKEWHIHEKKIMVHENKMILLLNKICLLPVLPGHIQSKNSRKCSCSLSLLNLPA